MERLLPQETQPNEKELSLDVTALGNLLFALNQAKPVGKTDELLSKLQKKE